jgi:hypothetical protein
MTRLFTIGDETTLARKASRIKPIETLRYE